MSLGAGNFILPIPDMLEFCACESAVAGIGSVTPDSTRPHPPASKLANSIELNNNGLKFVGMTLAFNGALAEV